MWDSISLERAFGGWEWQDEVGGGALTSVGQSDSWLTSESRSDGR
jgi:hypothetical protein